MIEAELKARVRDPEDLLRRLDRRATARPEVYRDTYFDTPDGTLTSGDRELRIRTVHGGSGGVRSLLTYKEPRVDEASASKPEHETHIDVPAAMQVILGGLGYLPAVAFEKRCRNYVLEERGRQLLATVVRIPEIEGTFVEVETLTTEEDLQAALGDVRAVLGTLGIAEDDLTTEPYTAAVAARRQG
ncbi:class IV adenylate cyclase [Streptomyces gamaensis]|uniref:Class IV adenylate cyclase n=1 Tax=Streptomyces gamaensis TaxID=1763542 RepID=A0ABW0YUF7_9ACTN